MPLYFVARLAREHVKVVLTGEGADELFLGYNRYRVTLWNAAPRQAVLGADAGGARVAAFATSWTRLPQRARRYAGRSFMALEPGIRDLFLENFAVFPQALQRQLLADRRLLDAATLRRRDALLRRRRRAASSTA